MLLAEKACAPTKVKAPKITLIGGNSALNFNAATASCAIPTGGAIQTLNILPVKGRAPKTGYTRAQFGEAWADTNHNNCDTHNDVLRRDLANPQSTGCRVNYGTFVEPFTGQPTSFIYGQNSHLTHIDHLVALSNAWQTGAQQITPAQRVMLANDPLNLLAVNGGLNEQKGDGDAATWLPPNKVFRCAYVARQIAVKAKYSLWVTQPEKEAMLRVLSSCPGERLPLITDPNIAFKPGVFAAPAPAPKPAPTTQPAPAPAPQPSANDYQGTCPISCAAARRQGLDRYLPFPQGHRCYTSRMDRDHDGYACEKD